MHRGLFRATGGRVGTERARAGRVGTLFLETRGHRSGERRRNAVFYVNHGDDLVVVASNAGASKDPAWWRNLQGEPSAVVMLGAERGPVHARQASDAELVTLWPVLVAANPNFETYRQTANRPIPVVILERRARES